jgi:hypothetical protein
MTISSDPTKDPEFQRVVQTFLRTPPQSHKSGQLDGASPTYTESYKMGKYRLADAMFRQLRAHVANDPDSAGNARNVTEAVERYNRIVEYGVRYWQSRKPVK